MRTFGKLMLAAVLLFSLICDVTYAMLPRAWKNCPKSVQANNKMKPLPGSKKGKAPTSDVFGDPPDGLCEHGGTCIIKHPSGTSSNVSTALQIRQLMRRGLIRCLCPVGFGGVRCEYEVCTPSTCKNGGTCNEKYSYGRSERPTIICNCLPGFQGRRCESRAVSNVTVTCKKGQKSSETVNCINGECTKYREASAHWKRLVLHDKEDVKGFGKRFNIAKPAGVAFEDYLVCLCKPGWTGDECDISCFDRKRYGDYCQHKCLRCVYPTTCDPETGECNTKVPNAKCIEGENCFHGKCLKTDPKLYGKSEICICEPGFRGDMCNDECEAGRYGLGCSELCGRCDQPPCRSDNGHCPTGCRGPYIPPFCKTVRGTLTRAHGDVDFNSTNNLPNFQAALDSLTQAMDSLTLAMDEPSEKKRRDGDRREHPLTKRNTKHYTRSSARKFLAGVTKLLVTAANKISLNHVLSRLKFTNGDNSVRKRNMKRQTKGNILHAEFALDFLSNEVDESKLKGNLVNSLKKASDEVEIPGATVDKDSIEVRQVSNIIAESSVDDGVDGSTVVIVGGVVVVGVLVIVSLIAVIISKKNRRKVIHRQMSHSPWSHGSTTMRSGSLPSSVKTSRKASVSKSITSRRG